MRFFRLLHILYTIKRYNLHKILKKYKKANILTLIFQVLTFFIPSKSSNIELPLATRLAFDELGPVFVKFGQLLSTRPDLIPDEFIVELSKLQSQVAPFPGIIAKQIIQKSLHAPLEQVFSEFSDEAVASASIAQVHKAVLKDNSKVVAVKILRPGIAVTINKDIKLLRVVAYLIQNLFKDGKRLRLREVVEEFKKTITNELDFLQEAANATELSRLHTGDNKIIIPKVYYDYCSQDVIVMEWMNGTPISDLKTLTKKGISLEQLSHNGVAIFYTQVFNYGFFHADMHPGNIMCDDSGRYIALDFGIVGCLSEEDKRYLAINILAFFNRDYKKVAITHIESGWAPPETPIEELESAIRTVCEPIFNKPLAQISFGQVLIKLFQVSRRFGIVVQPQLVLLQKTIINVEGLGRMLNPNLDLWITAKPILEKWMRNQMGWRGLIKNIKAEMPYWSYALPLMPRQFINNSAHFDSYNRTQLQYLKLIKNYKWQNNLLILIVFILIIFILLKI